MLMDLHTHTHHSPDAEADTVSERAARASALGLRFIAVTDHVEINRWLPAADYGKTETEEFVYDSRAVFEGSVAEICAVQEQSTGVRLLCGAEVGQIPQDIALAEALYRDPRLDLVIGSVHELPDMPDFFFLDYDSLDVPALIQAYFEEELRLARTDCYDILGHLTYGLRYLPERMKPFPLEPYFPVIDEIFRTLIAKDKALELNGSGLKSEHPFTDPGLSLIRRYHDLGGRLLTLSTDAHANCNVGRGMSLMEEMARAAGFTELTWLEKHTPQFVKL